MLKKVALLLLLSGCACPDSDHFGDDYQYDPDVDVYESVCPDGGKLRYIAYERLPEAAELKLCEENVR